MLDLFRTKKSEEANSADSIDEELLLIIDDDNNRFENHSTNSKKRSRYEGLCNYCRKYRYILLALMCLTLVGGAVAVFHFFRHRHQGNGVTCSDSVVRFRTPRPKRGQKNCLSFEKGKTYHYPADFSIKNKVQMFQCESSQKRIMTSNGIPDHTLTQGNPNNPCEIPWYLEFPLSPKYGNSTSEPGPLGIVAMALNGVPVYGAQEGGGSNAVEPSSKSHIQDAKYWWGHSTPFGDHHYHNSNMGYKKTPNATTLIAFAMDGFPIFGAVDDASILDACNGQMVGDNYQYHIRTNEQVDESEGYCQKLDDNDNNDKNDDNDDNDDDTVHSINWNYVVGCYHGLTSNTVVKNNYQTILPDDCVLVYSSY